MKDYSTYGLFPILPIRNTVLFPGQVVPLRVGRPKSVAALLKAQKENKSWIITVTQRAENEKDSDAAPDSLYSVGTLCRIERIRGSEENGYQVIVRGISRFRINEYKDEKSILFGQAEEFNDLVDLDESTSEALLTSLKSLSREILQLLPGKTEPLSELVEGIDDVGFLCHLCAGNLVLPIEKKQEILELGSLKTRALQLLTLLQQQKEALKVQSEIQEKISSRMGKMQREAFLREQLKAIQEELGEGDSSKEDDYRKKIDEAKMPAEVLKIAQDELKKLQTTSSNSPETQVIRNYLDLLCAIPWSKGSAEPIDLKKSRETLEKDHYGLNKIKTRILQHLAVMKRKENKQGSILLFVGPPGVGKTSLGQSVAKALGRKFVRASLGGVRDDAEIRGHRRTYIGAMPGRIVQGIKRAGENNPVFMLDEIDKLSHSFQGDPASALLEVLDPEQNSAFLDHYLDVPIDLSKVFFIATANTLETIPGPLLDRMEVIDLTGYTTAEKLHIAKNHLIPKELEEHGFSNSEFSIGDEAILRLIHSYTREAGVRDLKRRIALLCRSSVEKFLDTEKMIQIKEADLNEILGPEKFVHEIAERLSPPGVVTGLAWTPMGGEILFIEAGFMPGTGKLILTGQLGNVMKESAQIALSLAKSKLSLLAPHLNLDTKDIHIHVPAGAIAKDGPSAGVAMFTSITSLFAGRHIDPTLAMTGEITLRGAVLPVGGIKEKVIAAHRAGIEKVILPKRNQKDLYEVPDEVKNQLKFSFVETASELLKLTMELDDAETAKYFNDSDTGRAEPAVPHH